jgi:hypothetical protein
MLRTASHPIVFEPCIPTQADRPPSRGDQFFCIFKHFRAIETLYEKTARNFLAGPHLVRHSLGLNDARP